MLRGVLRKGRKLMTLQEPQFCGRGETNQQATKYGMNEETSPQIRFASEALTPRSTRLEVEADFGREGPRSNVVGSTKSGQEVIYGCFVCDVDRGEPRTPPVTVAVE
jgi:hypothetical protein